MDKNFRMKYLESIKQRYLNCPKDGKSVILSEFCRVCGYDRKYAITLLHKIDSPPSPRKSSKRPIIYWPDIHAILDLWEQSNFPWSVRHVQTEFRTEKGKPVVLISDPDKSVELVIDELR